MKKGKLEEDGRKERGLSARDKKVESGRRKGWREKWRK